MKRVLPDSHTDFVFAVVGEEFGIVLCLLIVVLFTVLVGRGLMQALRRNSAFERMAIAGLSTQIGIQAFINMGVNLHLLPAKGMTLPFISYGGSALLSSAITMGFLLALSRRYADARVTHGSATADRGERLRTESGLGRRALLVAGGTGGHLFPALALREVLVRRGWIVHLATDPRVGELVEGVPAAEQHRIPSATFSLGSPMGALRGLAPPAAGGSPFAQASEAGSSRRRDRLWRISDRPASGRCAARKSSDHRARTERGGRPRQSAAAAYRCASRDRLQGPEERRSRDPLRLCRQPRPQGRSSRQCVRMPRRRPASPSSFWSSAAARGRMCSPNWSRRRSGCCPRESRWRITVVQQARPEDLKSTREAYVKLGIEAEIEPFFSDMGERLAEAHLVVCRAGASTVAELAAIGRPAILVPYPHALDHDQAENARVLC